MKALTPQELHQTEFKNYLVSRDGQVFSKLSNRFLKTDQKRPYPAIIVCSNGKQRRVSIHRLVALTFIPNPENKPCVNHINGVKWDSRVENLEWCTYSENELHSHHVLGKKIIHSPETRKKLSLTAKGRDMSKAIEGSVKKTKGHPAHNRMEVVLNGTTHYKSIREASVNTGLSRMAIANNLNGISKFTRAGYWSYSNSHK
jgi:hypothetical protein